MKTQLGTKLLTRISQQLEQNPLWAILLANEYLSPNQPLHKALQLKAQAKLYAIKYPKLNRDIIKRILAGEKLVDLPKGIAPLLSKPAVFNTARQYEFVPAQIATRSHLQNSIRASRRVGNE